MAELVKPKSRNKKKSKQVLENPEALTNLEDLKEILKEANPKEIQTKEALDETTVNVGQKTADILESSDTISDFVDCKNERASVEDNNLISKQEEIRHSEPVKGSQMSDVSDCSVLQASDCLEGLKIGINNFSEVYPKLDEEIVDSLSPQANQGDKETAHEYVMPDIAPIYPLIRDISMELPPIQQSQMRPNIYPLLVPEDVLPPSGLVCSPSAPPMEDEDNELGIELPKLYPYLERSESLMQPFTEDQIRTLYYNPEMERLDEIIDEFFHSTSIFDHEFYRMLFSYRVALEKCESLSKDLEVMQRNLDDLKELVWETKTHNDVIKGPCQDGIVVQAVISYETASLNEESCSAFSEAQKKLRDALHEDFVMSLFNTHSCKLKIENYMSNFLEENQGLSSVPHVNPSNGREDSSLECGISELKEMISILFAFQRKQSNNYVFVSDTRKWLSILVSRLLLHATFGDHLFLTLQVLHCPPGISSWAIAFIQPTEMVSTLRSFNWQDHQWDNKEFNHNIALLALILKPMKYREEMLNMGECKIKDENEDQGSQGWIFIDSDGEDGGAYEDANISFHEKDILALLNQLSFEKTIKYLFVPSTGQSDNELFFSNESNFVKMLALARQIVDTLGVAMRNYPQARYKRLNRKLGQMIKNIVHSLCLGWMVFKDRGIQIPGHMMQRIQLESDIVLLLSVIRILQAPSLGAWQYMSILPFDALSDVSTWNLLRLIHLLCSNALEIDCEAYVSEHECRELLYNEMTMNDFAEKLLCMTSVEATFLLTTLAFVARMRRSQDVLEFITEEIFAISFVNPSTRTLYSKLGKELLQSICLQHLSMVKKLLGLIEKHVEETGMATSYLVQALPFHVFRLSTENCEMIRNWLINAKPNEPTNHLARTILNCIDWSFKWNENVFRQGSGAGFNSCNSIYLFLPKSVHKFMALSVLDALNHHIQGKITAGKLPTNAIMSFPLDSLSSSGSISRLSSFLPLYQGHPEELLLFNTWSWCFCLRLKLHSFSILAGKYFACKRAALDESAQNQVLYQIINDIMHHVQNPHEDLGDDANDDGGMRLKDCSAEALEGRYLLSSYLILCMTSRGYSTSEFMLYGVKCLLDLLDAGHIIPSLHVLYNCLPMFYLDKKAAVDLLSKDSFMKCIDIILKQDSIEKTSFDTNSRNSIICQLTALILGHMELFNTKMELFENVVAFWLHSLTKVSNWSNNRDILYVMNNTLKKTFKCDPKLKMPTIFFKDYLKRTQNEGRPISSASTGFLSSITGLFWSRTSEFLSESSASKDFPWYRFVILQSERSGFEEDNDLWNSLELKDVCSKRGVDHQAFPVQKLSIFRYASMVLEMSVTHELYALVWNEFLGMYFTRSSQGKSHGLGHNLLSYSPESRTLMKKLKVKCNKCIGELKMLQDQFSDPKMVDRLIQLNRVIHLWLDEQRLHDPMLSLTLLPPQYAASLFQSLIKKEQYHWYGFMDHPRMEAELDVICDSWFQNVIDKNSRPHQDDLNKLAKSLEIKDPHERLLASLNSKPPTDPVPPPQVDAMESVFSELTPDVYLDDRKLNIIIHADLKTVCDMASMHEKKVAKHMEMDEYYLDNLKKLYSNITVESVEVVQCWSFLHPTYKCKGGAVLKKRHERKHLNEIAGRRLKETKDILLLLIKDCSKLAQLVKASRAVIRVEAIISKLVRQVLKASQHDRLGEEQANRNIDIGTNLFYLLVSFVKPMIERCPVAREFVHSCVETLGKEFIVNSPQQAETLLLVILNNSELVCLLSQFFNPNSSPNDFLLLYEQVQNLSSSRKYDAAAAVAAKFDVGTWAKHSWIDQNSDLKLLKLIVSALSSLGQKPSSEALCLSYIHRSHLQILCLEDLSVYLMPLLIELLSSSESSTIDPEVWDDYSGLLGINFIKEAAIEPDFENVFHSNNSILLTKHQIFQLLDHMTDHFCDQVSTLRRQGSHRGGFRSEEHQWLYGRWKVYVPHLSRAFYSMVVVMVMKLRQMMMSSTASDAESTLKDLADMYTKIQSLYLVWISWSDVLNPCWRADSTALTTCLPEIGHMISSWLKSIETLHALFEKDMKQQGWVLNYTLSFYMNNLGVQMMPEFLINAFDAHLITLPWNELQPRIVCIDNMAKAIDYPKPCFEMMGNIFCAVDWKMHFPLLTRNVSNSEKAQLHSLIFLILVRLANEKVVLENTHLPQLLSSMDIFDWSNMLDAWSYSQSLEWFANSCDPTPLITMDLALSSCQVIRLFKVASNFYPKPYQASSNLLCFNPNDEGNEPAAKENTFKKRCSYVRFMVRIIAKSSSSENPNFDHLKVALSNLLSEIDAIMSKENDTGNVRHESRMFCSECLFLMNLCPSAASANIFFEVFQQWMESSVMSPLLIPMVTAACKTLRDVSQLSRLIEVFITVYFSLDVTATELCGWGRVLSSVEFPNEFEDKFIFECLNKEHFFTLYLFVLFKLSICQKLSDELAIMLKLNDWNTSARPSANSEGKMFLWWHKILELSLKQVMHGGSKLAVRSALVQMVPALMIMGEDKSATGIFGIIGFGKKSGLSLRFRVVACGLAGFILSILLHDSDLLPSSDCRNDTLSDLLKVTDANAVGQLQHQIMSRLKAMSNDKNYCNYSQHVQLSVRYSQDNTLTLMNFKEVLSKLVEPLFPEYYLGIIHSTLY